MEGWHHAFDTSVNCHHPDMYHFVNLLRKEEDNVRSDVVRASPKRKQRKYIVNDQQVHNIVSQYDTKKADIVNYLHSLSYRVAL